MLREVLDGVRKHNRKGSRDSVYRCRHVKDEFLESLLALNTRSVREGRKTPLGVQALKAIDSAVIDDVPFKKIAPARSNGQVADLPGRGLGHQRQECILLGRAEGLDVEMEGLKSAHRLDGLEDA